MLFHFLFHKNLSSKIFFVHFIFKDHTKDGEESSTTQKKLGGSAAPSKSGEEGKAAPPHTFLEHGRLNKGHLSRQGVWPPIGNDEARSGLCFLRLFFDKVRQTHVEKNLKCSTMLGSVF